MRKRSLFLSVIFVIFLITCNALPPVEADELRIQMGRPGSNGKPTSVEVGIWIIDIDSIDSVAQSFAANVFIILKWNDPRLVNIDRKKQKYSL